MTEMPHLETEMKLDFKEHRHIWEFPKLGVPFLGVLIIRTPLFKVPYLDILFSETPICKV